MCQFQTLALGGEKVSKAIVLKSSLGPGQKHDLTAEAAEIDAGVDPARGRERETVDHDGRAKPRAADTKPAPPTAIVWEP